MPVTPAIGNGRCSGARVYDSAGGGSVTAATFTAITFNSEYFDTDGYHDTGSNTSRLTVPFAGKYLINGQVGVPSTTNMYYLQIRLNGSTNLQYHSFDQLTLSQYKIVTTVANLAAGDYVELVIYGDTNTFTLTNAAAQHNPSFQIACLGV